MRGEGTPPMPSFRRAVRGGPEAAPFLHRPGTILVVEDELEDVERALASFAQQSGLEWRRAGGLRGIARLELAEERAPGARARSRPAVTTVDWLRERLRRADSVALDHAVFAPEVATAVEFAAEPRYQGRIPPDPAPPPERLPELGGGATRRVAVGVLDTGIDADHRWLAGRAPGHSDPDHPDVAEPLRELDPVAGHGTFIAGQVLQLAPQAVVHAIDVLDPEGVVSDAELVEAIERLLQRVGGHLDVLSLSLGGWTQGDRPPLALARTLRSLALGGTAIVAAAGNLGSDRPFWPAAYKDVIAVGALEESGHGLRPAEFSNFGWWVDALAPGTAQRSSFLRASSRRDGRTVRYEGWARWSGTSFAAPWVAGAIAAELAGREGASGQEVARELLARAPGTPLGAPWTRFPVAGLFGGA